MSDELHEWKESLLATLDTGLKYSRELNLDEYEIFAINSKSVNVEIINGLINAKNGGQIGLGCRVVIDNKIGYASSSGHSEKSVKFAIENARDVANSITYEDEKWESFTSNTEIGNEGIIDPNITNYDGDQIVSQVSELISETMGYDKRIFSMQGSFNSNYGVVGVGNSNGILKASSYTSVTGGFQIQAKDGGKVKSEVVAVLRRDVPNTLQGLSEQKSKRVIEFLDAKPLDSSQKLSIVLDPMASSQLTSRSLVNSINGQSVINKQSAFADKIGEKIAYSKLNLFDDGQEKSAPNTHAIDGEGNPKKTTQIIENGVLLSYVFDDYHARIYDTESTGNASRGGAQSYENPPSISLNTTRVVPESNSTDDLILDMNKGIFVTGNFMGLHTTNLISGDFSIVNQHSYLVEDGEISHPLNPITLAGNHYEFLAQIEGIGDEQIITPGFFTGPNIIPSLHVSGISVSG